MRRTKEDAAATRKMLLKAALQIFSRKGYSAATLEDVAREAGVTRGAIYWHFGSKAELYNALINDYSNRGMEIVQAAAGEGGSFLEILRRILVHLLEAVENEATLRAVMEISLFKTERTGELEASLQQNLQVNRALIDSITQAMRQGMDAGELRQDIDAEDLARCFLAFQNGAAYLWLQDPQAFSLKKSAPAFAEVFVRGVAPLNNP